LANRAQHTKRVVGNPLEETLPIVEKQWKTQRKRRIAPMGSPVTTQDARRGNGSNDFT
jgi:hypothetical protein